MKFKGKTYTVKARPEIFSFTEGEVPVVNLYTFYIDGEEVEEKEFNDELRKLMYESSIESDDQ